jgi:hypothetical protein
LGKLKRKDLLSKAEKCLHKTLEYDPEEEGKIKTDLLRIQTDIAKFITSTQGKDKGYSNRTEITGENGKDLIPDQESKEVADRAINIYLNGIKADTTKR